MELGWSNVLQAVVMAACTWYMRNGSKADSKETQEKAAKDNDMVTVKAELIDLKSQFAIFKNAYFAQNPAKPDHRSPK